MTNPPTEPQGSNTVNSRGEVVAGEAGYASLPPPGSITSPPTPAYFSPVPTPPSATTRSASAAQPYPTYQDGLPPAPQVLYHTPYVPRQPGQNGLGSPFIPMAGNQAENLVGNAYAFNEVMSTLQSLSHNAGYPLGEPFNLLPPNDIMHVASMARGDPANGYHPQGSHGAHGRSDSGNQRSTNAPYRPPHVQRKAALDVPPHLTQQRQVQGMAGNPFFGMPDARDNWWQNPQNQMAEIHRQSHPVGNGAVNGHGSVRRKDNQVGSVSSSRPSLSPCTAIRSIFSRSTSARRWEVHVCPTNGSEPNVSESVPERFRYAEPQDGRLCPVRSTEWSWSRLSKRRVHPEPWKWKWIWRSDERSQSVQDGRFGSSVPRRRAEHWRSIWCPSQCPSGRLQDEQDEQEMGNHGGSERFTSDNGSLPEIVGASRLHGRICE